MAQGIPNNHTQYWTTGNPKQISGRAGAGIAEMARPKTRDRASPSNLK